MPDFTPYTAAEYAPDAPATALHFQRWFQNWEAGFEGAPNAPRLLPAALERLLPGTTARLTHDVASAVAEPTVVHFVQWGTVRVTLEQFGDGAAHTVSIVRQSAAGVQTVLQSWATTSAGVWVARSVDVSVVRGERLIFRQTTGGGGASGQMRNRRIQTSGAFLWPAIGTTQGVELP